MQVVGVDGRKESRGPPQDTYTDIHTQTRIAKTVLSRLGNDRAEMVGISVIYRLCDYFDCQPGDHFVFVPEREVYG